MMKSTIIYGPPGTGKTEQLIREVDERRQRTLYLSFTRTAAAEAASRIKNPELVTPSTIHSLAFRALNMNRASVVDARKLQEFSLASGIPFKDPRREDDQEQEGNEFMCVHEYAANRLLSEDEAYDEFGRPGSTPRYRMFVDAYQDWKAAFGYVDFNDMLLGCLKHEFPKQSVVALDEAQDLSPLQWRVFNRICARTSEVLMAGDDDQAIFEWSGADPHGMDSFVQAHGKTALVRILDKSYRVPQEPFNLADKHARGNIKRRVMKVFRPADRDGTVLQYGSVQDIDMNAPLAEPGKSVLILVRDRHRSLEMQRLLNQQKIPYSVNGGYSPWDNRWARAIRGVLRLSNNEGTPTEQQRDAILTCCVPAVRQAVIDRQYKTIAHHDWRSILEVPMHLIEFYDDLDFETPIDITLSTIHQAKGREAHTVLLDLELSPRVLENMHQNRDAEARVLYVALTRASERLILCGSNPFL